MDEGKPQGMDHVVKAMGGTDYFKKEPKPFDYAAFIAELRELSTPLPSTSRNVESPEFYQWRHKLHDLIVRIEKQGYDINCAPHHRAFDAYGYAINPADRRTAFDKDMGMTLMEMKTIIGSYENYGDPKPATTPVQSTVDAAPPATPAPAPLQWPEKEKMT